MMRSACQVCKQCNSAPEKKQNEFSSQLEPTSRLTNAMRESKRCSLRVLMPILVEFAAVHALLLNVDAVSTVCLGGKMV
ncbi:hypothetical protein F4823DRAFT_608406, partial [Ustulina deusta]